MRLLGLDGCKHNAWVIAESDSEFTRLTFRIEADLAAIFDQALCGECLAVMDVPIGLSRQPRAADVAARKRLDGKWKSSVFRPPCREALAATTHEDASALNRLHCDGVGLAIMAFGICPRIKTVDDLITPEHQKHIREGHPELSFVALNGDQSLNHDKHTEDGVRERLALLLKAGLPAFDPHTERRKLGLAADVAVDDVVDAAVMLVTARDVAAEVARRVPSFDQRDDRELLMEMWMPKNPEGMSRSKSGVHVYHDFRDNLIIDRYHPDLAAMRGSKRDRLRSENSEDALTWNVFRSLAQIDPSFWLPLLRSKAFPDAAPPSSPEIVTTHLWMEVHPPPSLRLHQKDEGPSEIDIVIETEVSVWFIEAKFKSDISTRTTNNLTRDQIIRNLDVGSWYAGVRDFYFALLITDQQSSRKGVDALQKMGPSVPALPHRPDGMKNVKGCGLMRWRDVADVLQACGDGAPRDDERGYARRALGWMRERGLVEPATT